LKYSGPSKFEFVALIFIEHLFWILWDVEERGLKDFGSAKENPLSAWNPEVDFIESFENLEFEFIDIVTTFVERPPIG